MNSNNYYNEIRSDIAKEFGFEALGFGSPRITTKQLLDAQSRFNAMSEAEQDALIASRRVR